MAYRPELVARIKGALRAGLGPKLVSKLTGIPVDTVKEWSADMCRGEITADATIANDLTDIILGRFNGRKSEL